MSDAPGFAGVERRWGPGVVQVVVAEEAALLRRRLVLVLEAHPRIEVVAESIDLDSLVDAVEVHRPTVAVVDGRLPPDGGGAAVDAVVFRDPAICVVVISDAHSVPLTPGGSAVVEVAREDVMARLADSVVAAADGARPDRPSP